MGARHRPPLASTVWPGLAIAVLLAAGALVATMELDPPLLARLRHPDDPAHALGPLWLRESVRDITALGSNTVLTVVLAVTAVTLGLLGKPRRAVALVASAAGALVAVNLLKIAFGRHRPDLLAELPVVSPSFPSSHAMMAAAIYLVLGLMLAEAVARPALRASFVAMAAALVLATGLSRIYLGIHWPSDVLVGWALGFAWALASARVFAVLARRGVLEPMAT